MLVFGGIKNMAVFFSSFSKIPVMNVFYIYTENVIFLSQNQIIINSSKFLLN